MKPREYYLEYVNRILRISKVMQISENPITVMTEIIKETGMDLDLKGLQNLFRMLDEECIDRERKLREEDLMNLGYDRDSVSILIFIGAIIEIRTDLSVKYPDVSTETEI